jgi:hypothetical protein
MLAYVLVLSTINVWPIQVSYVHRSYSNRVSSCCIQRPIQPPVQWVPGILSPGVKRGRDVTLTTHPHQVQRSWMSRSYTSSPPKHLHGVYRDCFTFTFYRRSEWRLRPCDSFTPILVAAHRALIVLTFSDHRFETRMENALCSRFPGLTRLPQSRFRTRLQG